MAQFIPNILKDLNDVPAYSGNAGKVLKVNTGETAPEWAVDETTDVGDVFNDSWAYTHDYGVSGSNVETTLAANLGLGSTSATLTDASSYLSGHDMAIPGAGVAGIELMVTLSADPIGNVVSFSPATSTSVLSGITVYHDDTVGWNAAIASGNQLWGAGVSVITGEIDFNVVGQRCYSSYLSIGGAISIRPRDLTQNAIRVSANAVHLHGINIRHPYGTPTAGSDFILGNTGSGVSGTRLTKCSTVLPYIGITFQRGFNWTLDDIAIFWPVKYGVDINSPIPYGGHRVHNLIMGEQSPSGVADSAIHISASDWIRWSHITMARFETCIHIEADIANVSGQRFTDMYFDDCRATAVKVAGSTFGVVDTSIVNLQLYNNDASANGIQILDGAVNTVIDDISVIGSAGFGIEDGGADTSINNFKCRNAGWTMNTADGLSLTSTSTGCMVSNSTFGYNRYGLAIASGASDFNITGNNFKNNNTAATNIPTNARASGIIENNNGITDYLTSIGATPDFVGQYALISGTWYKAKATTSTGDWVAI